ARRRADGGGLRPARELRDELRPPAWRAGTARRGALPRADPSGAGRGPPAPGRAVARAHPRGDGVLSRAGRPACTAPPRDAVWSRPNRPSPRMLTAADFQPPRLLRNPHLQSVLGSSALRRHRGLRALAAVGAQSRELILDGGNGVRLQGWHSRVPGVVPRGMALLLHGWEGSAESGYMRMTAARLLACGFEVFRLNFRDHGDTHHLNEDLFHSNRLDEVVHAAADMVARLGVRDLVVAGYSLGGNHALRLGLRAALAGLPLRHIAAVCPLVDPSRTMEHMERAPQFYDWYFRRKWRSSLLRKRELFPERFGYDDATLQLDLRGLMGWLAQRHAGFGS